MEIKSFNTPVKVYCLLGICSALIYFVYFHQILFHLNYVLSNIEGDSLKNYYTYVYHIKNDTNALHFSGMNFPYGEHIVYTDCQPLLTFVLRALPFTHNHLIGILHSLIFLSFIFTPLVLFRIFTLLEIEKFSAFFISLAVSILSPQYLKLLGGHYALAYTCIIPISILLLLLFFKRESKRNILFLCFWNITLFFIHPYLGFGSTFFVFLALLFYKLLHRSSLKLWRDGFQIFVMGLLPILLFKLFMFLSDAHVNRTTEPQNIGALVANLGSLLLPGYGPFSEILPKLFKIEISNFEGQSYLGLFTLLLSLIFIVLSPFFKSHLSIHKETLSIFLASVILLFLAFGFHNHLLELLHLKIQGLDQFRASGRFIWFFYYAYSLFLIPLIYKTLASRFKVELFAWWLRGIAVLYFCCSLFEAHFLFQLNPQAYWKSRNFFNEKLLNPEEKKIVQQLRGHTPQAIVPLPMFHFGSEMYERQGGNNSTIPSFIYSYHCKIPILSVMLSRTSISETENVIQLLNGYKQKKEAALLLNNLDFFIIKTKDSLLPDEKRLLKKTRLFKGNDSLSFGFISKNRFLSPYVDRDVYSIPDHKHFIVEKDQSLVFIPYENRKPFLKSNINDYETIFVLDSTKIKSGSYIVSFHYHYKSESFRSLANILVITKAQGQNYSWHYNIPISHIAGFYKDFGVFEYKIDLEKEAKYEFILKGYLDYPYHISNFMLRPETLTVKSHNIKKDTTINNFPN